MLGSREHGGSYSELSFDGKLNFERQNVQTIYHAATLKRAWHTGECGAGQFSPDGSSLFCTSPKGLKKHDAFTGKVTGRLPGPTSGQFAPSPDGNFLYSIDEGKILRWRAR